MIHNLWEDYGVEANDDYDMSACSCFLSVVVVIIIIICFAIIPTVESSH